MTDVSKEARDYHGRWTTGGGDKPSVSLSDASEPNRVRADIISNLAQKSATALGYDPGSIHVTDEDHVFTLNGTERKAVGTAELETGKINIHANQVRNNEDVPSVMAHEIMHQKFQTFIKDYQTEKTAMEKDPLYGNHDIGAKIVKFDPSNPVHAAQKAAGAVIFSDGTFREKGFMRNDGLLNAPYDEKYPVYQAFTKAHMPGASEFAKTDGVSEYSREWWAAWHGKTADTSQAMHETLAEIARLKFEGHDVQHVVSKANGLKTIRKTPDPNWMALHRAVENHWKKRAKK